MSSTSCSRTRCVTISGDDVRSMFSKSTKSCGQECITMKIAIANGPQERRVADSGPCSWQPLGAKQLRSAHFDSGQGARVGWGCGTATLGCLVHRSLTDRIDKLGGLVEVRRQKILSPRGLRFHERRCGVQSVIWHPLRSSRPKTSCVYRSTRL